MAVILTIAGVDRTTLIAPNSLRATKKGKGINNFSLQLNTTAAIFIPKSGMEAIVYEDAAIRIAGIIKTVKKKRLTPEWGINAPIEVIISVDGYNEIPSRRTCTCEFKNKTAGYIVERMRQLTIDAEGVGAGIINDGITIPYFLMVCASLKQIYDELADSSGYNWYIDENKELYFVEEDAIVDADEDIVEEGTFTDFNNIILAESLADYRNKTFVVGKFGPDGNIVVVYYQDDVEIATRQTLEGGTGVYGNVIQDDNVTTPEDALILAELDVKKYAFEPAEMGFTSYKTDWVVGTRLKVNLPSLGLNTDTYFLIEEVSIYRIATGILHANLRCTKRRAGAEFSNQKTQSGTEYFVKVVREAKKKGGNYSGENTTVQYSIADYPISTAAQKILTTVESEILYNVIPINIKSDIKIFFSCSGEADANMDVMLIIYVDGIARIYQPVQTIVSGKSQILTITDTIEGEEAENSYDDGVEVSICGVTDTGNFTIPAGFANMNLLVIPALNAVPLLDVTEFAVEAIDEQEIDATWVNPNIIFIEVELYRSETNLASYNRTWCDSNATLIYHGTAESYNDTGLDGGTLYYYKIFVSYAKGYSLGVTDNATTDEITYVLSLIDEVKYLGNYNGVNNILMRISASLYMWTGALGSLRLWAFSYLIDGAYAINYIDDELAALAKPHSYCSTIMLDDTHFVNASRVYTSFPNSNKCHIKTFSCDASAGTIAEVDELVGFMNLGSDNSLGKLDSTHFILANCGSSNDGYLTTFSVDANADNIALLHQIEHDVSNGEYNSLGVIDSTHVVLAYAGVGQTGYIKIFSINGSYEMATEGWLQFDAVKAIHNSLVMLDASHFAVAYSGENDYGTIKIFSFDGAYAITEVSTLIHDNTSGTYYHSLAKVTDSLLALAYKGLDGDGYLKVFNVSGSYGISEAGVLEHDIVNAGDNSLVAIDDTHLFLAYNYGINRSLKTFLIT